MTQVNWNCKVNAKFDHYKSLQASFSDLNNIYADTDLSVIGQYQYQ